LRHLNRDYELLIPLASIERRLLEKAMETYSNQMKIRSGEFHSFIVPLICSFTRGSFVSDQVSEMDDNNCRELIKLAHDYLIQWKDISHSINDTFVNGLDHVSSRDRCS
jgi:hypothetical protein